MFPVGNLLVLIKAGVQQILPLSLLLAWFTFCMYASTEHMNLNPFPSSLNFLSFRHCFSSLIIPSL